MARKRASKRIKLRKRRLTMAIGAFVILGTCLTVRHYWGPEPLSARAPAPAPAKEPSKDSHDLKSLQVFASVNGEQVTREQLSQQCLRHYGKKVLESLVNKQIIIEACRKRNFTVTQKEVWAEILRMASKFNLSVEQYLGMLSQERGINPNQYASDIIWPMLALRKLAATSLIVSNEELTIAFETEYGPRVQVRMITRSDNKTARKVHQMALDNPDSFPSLAKNYSADDSASSGGLVHPIRRHTGFKKIEQAAFSMSDGQISDILVVGNQYFILRRDRLIPARKVRFEKVKTMLEQRIKDNKIQEVSSKIFRDLQEKAKPTLLLVLNDPEKSRRYPGIAAMVCGRQISISQLAQQCLERHAADVLEGVINHRLLLQELKKNKLQVTQNDIDQEIARAAEDYGMTTKTGKPDIEAWLKKITKQQKITRALYEQDAVWPSVALKKLVGDRIQITQDDIRLAFESNYGPRVRCLAIVLGNQRRAHEVWAMARDNPTDSYFGDLAKQYSVDPATKALRGEIPPIRRHGGRPALEQEAFSLQPGELSSIIHIGEQFIILRCLGQTQPDHKLEDVRQILEENLREKKIRIAMSRELKRIQDNAEIVNYLDPSKSRSPVAADEPGRVSKEDVRPVAHKVSSGRWSLVFP